MNGDLIYTPGTVMDNHRYEFDRWGRFDGDAVEDMSWDDIGALARSEDWQDRVRAKQLQESLIIRLPDQFPCIYETPDSPNLQRYPDTGVHRETNDMRAWVVSPDEDMLNELLPDYQGLWDHHILECNSHWGPSSRRTFAVGKLDRLRPSSLYRPGTTAVQVLRATIATHSFRVPEFLRDRINQYNQYVVRNP